MFPKLFKKRDDTTKKGDISPYDHTQDKEGMITLFHDSELNKVRRLLSINRLKGFFIFRGVRFRKTGDTLEFKDSLLLFGEIDCYVYYRGVIYEYSSNTFYVKTGSQLPAEIVDIIGPYCDVLYGQLPEGFTSKTLKQIPTYNQKG